MQIAVEIAGPQAAETDREARWPEDAIRALQTAGLGGLVIPESYGGLGQGLYALVRVCEVLGRECASTAMCFGMHCVAAAMIAAKATPWQQTRYLKPIAEGRHLASLSLSEPGSGAHFYLPQTRLEVIPPNSYRINGKKAFVTNSALADSYVVSTVTVDPNAPLGQFSCVVVPGDADGLVWGPTWNGLGMRGNASRSLELKDVIIAREELLGEEGDQIWYIFHVVVPYFLMAMAGTYLGIAQAALDATKNHLLSRQYAQNGSALAQLPVLQHHIGVLWGTLERTRSHTYAAARAFDAGDPDCLPAVFSAKAEVAECVVRLTNDALTLAGGIAYREDSQLHRHLRDARAAHVMTPTTDLLRIWTGRSLLGLPILGP